MPYPEEKLGWQIATFAASLPPQQLAVALHDAVVAGCTSKPVFVKEKSELLKTFEGLKSLDGEAFMPVLLAPVHDFLIGVEEDMTRMKADNVGKVLGVFGFTRDMRAWRQSDRCGSLVLKLAQADVGLSALDISGRAPLPPAQLRPNLYAAHLVWLRY